MSEAYARTQDPDTSHDAAESIRGKIATDLENLVISALKQRGGMTSQEVADYLNMRRDQVSPRFAPLKRKGIIIESGEKRRGDNGRLSMIWRIVEEGELVEPTKRKNPITRKHFEKSIGFAKEYLAILWEKYKTTKNELLSMTMFQDTTGKRNELDCCKLKIDEITNFLEKHGN